VTSVHFIVLPNQLKSHDRWYKFRNAAAGLADPGFLRLRMLFPSNRQRGRRASPSRSFMQSYATPTKYTPSSARNMSRVPVKCHLVELTLRFTALTSLHTHIPHSDATFQTASPQFSANTLHIRAPENRMRATTTALSTPAAPPSPWSRPNPELFKD
jgi:hypothetical protein